MHPETLSVFQALLLLIRYRIRSMRNQLRTLRRDSLLKIYVVGVLGSIFWAGLFLIGYHSLQFLSLHAPAPAIPFLIKNIMSLFFVALIFMLVFSNAVISFSNLFK